MDLGQLCRRRLDYLLLVLPGEVPPGVGADIGQPAPLVHAKFAHTDFNIQPVVILGVDATPRQVLPLHHLVDLLATLDLCNQLSPRIGEFAQEALVPLGRVCVAASRPLSSPDADEDANLAARPLVHHGLVESGQGRVEVARAVVVKHRLADLDGLEGKADGAGCPPGLPDGAVELGGWLSPRVIGAQHGRRAAFRGALVNGRHSTGRVNQPRPQPETCGGGGR